MTSTEWERFTQELLRRKREGIPVETTQKGRKNCVEEVGSDYVVLRRESTGGTVKISRDEIEGKTGWNWYVTKALRRIAGLPEDL